MSKGNIGYLEKKRRYSLIKSILFLAAVLIIYFVALSIYKTNKNVFSIVAAVGALPTGRSIVETIMCFRARSASPKVIEAVGKISFPDDFFTAYDLYLTAYERSYSLSHAAVGNGQLTGITEAGDTDCGLCERHISEMFGKEGISDYRIKIYRDLDEYKDALSRMIDAPAPQNLESDEEEDGDQKEKNQKAMALLLSISL